MRAVSDAKKSRLKSILKTSTQPKSPRINQSIVPDRLTQWTGSLSAIAFISLFQILNQDNRKDLIADSAVSL
jgi:hypothetical protein